MAYMTNNTHATITSDAAQARHTAHAMLGLPNTSLPPGILSGRLAWHHAPTGKLSNHQPLATHSLPCMFCHQVFTLNLIGRRQSKLRLLQRCTCPMFWCAACCSLDRYVVMLHWTAVRLSSTCGTQHRYQWTWPWRDRVEEKFAVINFIAFRIYW